MDFVCLPFQRSRSTAEYAVMQSVEPKTSTRATTNMGLCRRPRYRCSVVPVDQCQVGTVPGPQPQEGPPQRLAPLLTWEPGESSATDRSKSPATIVRVVQWIAEDIQQKKPEMQAFLGGNPTDKICIKETYLKELHRLLFRGYDIFRPDRLGGRKGVHHPSKTQHPGGVDC